MKRCKAWQAKKADAGFAGITWPKRFGGRELSPIFQVIYNQEEEEFHRAARPVRDRPRHVHPHHDGLCQTGTTRPLRATRRCAAKKCGASCSANRPAAPTSPPCARARNATATTGSSTARRSGPRGAHLSDFGIIVVRTDPNVPKHEGLTFFFLDMKSPGIDIRPIHQMSGTRHFNEVFFTDVRVPDTQRLGQVGAGLARVAHHADERTPRGWRSARGRMSMIWWRSAARWCSTASRRSATRR